MDAITSYIDHMFRSLPPTTEVSRARSELLQMSEDRYRELLAEGVSENEAVGRVITQFGNLDELADDLGIRRELDRAGSEGEGASVEFSHEEAEHFLDVRRRGAWFISAGVFVILLGISQLVFFAEGTAGVDGNTETVPLALLFVCIAGAVALFIVGGVSLSRYDRLEHKELRLEPQVATAYRAQREREQGTFVALLAGGVALIILAVAIPAIFVDATSGPAGNRAVALMLVIIAIGVTILIQAGMRRGALDRLTAEGDYAPEKRRSNSITGRVAGPYWMLAAAVFLGWSFIGDAWDRSWMVWPIAGILFGAVVVTIESFSPDKRKVDGGR
ncbi:permease prefix domain 1-containing protein [Occultella gossypii]|uniref:DUF1700 domain-containing protein n=1 Tax=Occultella gossypii TaxID=2800820 RepID=A0ABS7SA15_9MICO|nr:permease prefix domain 1-containing protein [Occultella gossypii]MBZ2197191.1 hypothetical protein [Occultella gossypii]